ncbi:MAG TPA: GDP-mannose 4,6-dehydratase [bacterium]|nr:GDP-mannose 4,6-dehydratase [bacterium]
MKYLITGGAGFIGSHLAETLLRQGNKVVIIDDLSTGSINNIETFKNHPNLEKHIDTILNEELLADLVKEADFIYHLAAAVGVKYIIENALHSLLINSKGTELVLKYANKFGNKPLLITSTSEVYGKNENVPFKETDDSLLGPTYITRWGYACSKAFDEFLALAYYRERKLPVTIVRLFNTCGPRQTGQYGMVIPRFVMQALKNEPLTVFGDGEQTRSFTSVYDVCWALIKLSVSENAAGEIFNIGNNIPISIKELAEKIVSLTKSKSPIKFISYEDAFEKGFEDMKHRIPDISKISQYTGYKPKINTEDLLISVIKEKQLKLEG